MLQIISGKFYGDGYIHENPTEVFLYSNAIIEKKIVIAGIEISPVYLNAEGDVTEIQKYCINFNNKIEHQPGGFSIVNAWSEVVVYQLKNILTFYFDSFWDEDQLVVKKMCKERVSTGKRMDFVPANYLRSNLDLNLEVHEDAINNGTYNIQRLIALSRKDYNTMITCIRTYCASIRLLENDPNLAYSMLIFALESLSQSYDEYVPVWEDYDENIKNKLEQNLKGIDERIREEIKQTLLTDSHLKLSRRFLHFILNYLDDGYYLDKKITNKILKDDVEDALKNAYNIRSKYAHALKLIMDQSVVDNVSKESDFYRSNSDPFLTYSGLLRLTKYVIVNFISNREMVEKERIDWTENLPGMMKGKLGPDFWMSKMESENCLGASIRLEGYISGLSNNKVYEITDVIKMYIERFDHVKEEMKRSIFALCIIWKDTAKHSEEQIQFYKQFIDNHKERINICCIQNIVLFSFLLQDSYTVEWDEQDVEKELFTYIKSRKKEKAFLFPNLIETNMYILASDILKEDKEKNEFWIQKAKYNSANNDVVLEIVSGDLKSNEKIEAIWEYIWEK